MKNSWLQTVAVGAALLISGCASAPLAPKPQGKAANRLDFSDLQVGQTSRYLRFVAENYWDRSDTSRVVTADTLEISVIGQEGARFIIRERITPGSRASSDTAYAQSIGLYNGSDVYVNRIYVRNDSLFFDKDTSRSGGSFLFLYATAGMGIVRNVLPLALFSGPELELYGWKTSYCECYKSGMVPVLNQLGREYRELNIVVDNVFMQTDGPGFTNIYSYSDGIVRAYWTNWWTGAGLGWDLL